MSASPLNTLLEKAADWDKDERYMATSDLCNELQKDLKIDATMERRICAAVLKQLDDSSNDVQSIAVKCLGILLKKVQEAQVGEICDKLCTLILEGKPELRDIYSIGLKTLISDVPDAMGPSVAGRLTKRLLGGVEQNEVVEMKLECLDNLTDLIKRFGREVEADHTKIVDVVMKQLCSPRPVVRKRAAVCLGSVAVVVPDSLLNRMTESLLDQIKRSNTKDSEQADIMRTLIQTIGTICRTVGYRLGRHLNSIIPLFLKCCGDPEDESQHTEQANELRENCFQGFESFVIRCPREVTPHMDTIIKAALQYIKYDPNYNYGDSDDDADGMADMEDDYGEDAFSDDDAGSEDDDTGWKVRRSAVKVLGAVISCRPEMLQDLYNSCCDELVSRFKEREENVRVDVIMCFNKLLEATLNTTSRRTTAPGGGEAHLQYHYFQPHEMVGAAPGGVDEEPPALQRQKSAVNALELKLPAIVKAVDKQLKGKSHKTISTVYQMLRTLCRVLHGGLDRHMGTLMADVHRSLVDKNHTLKLEALLFLRLAMEMHPPAAFHPYIPGLVQDVAQCVAEDWYKVIAEALRCTGALIRIIRPLPPASAPPPPPGETFDYRPYVKPLYNAIFPRLSAHDIDQEIKECAINAMGLLLAHMGDELGDELPVVLQLLMDRLKNEITRMSTLKTLALISVSPVNVNLGGVLCDATVELASFLKQQSRPLRQATLESLIAFVGSNWQQMKPDLLDVVVRDAAPLVVDSDLHLAHLALHFTYRVLAVTPSAAETVRVNILPRCMVLASSPLLQGLALRSLLQLYQQVLAVGAPGLTFKELLLAMQEAVEQGGKGLSKQAIGNIAKCMAVLCANTNQNQRSSSVASFVQHIKGNNPTKKHLALLVVGELGHQTDLSTIVGDLQSIVLGTFDTDTGEEVKTAAAYALGHMTVGNMDVFLPVVLTALDGSRHQYLLLSSVKEVIMCHARDPQLQFAPYVDQVLPHLFRHTESEEEGVRNMVAECLGVLTAMQPKVMVPALLQLKQTKEDPLTRWTLATALKYTMTGRTPVQELAPHMRDFLAMLNDEDLDVKRAAFLMVNAAIHHQPHLVADLLPKMVVPVLYETIELKLERVVDLGPFKHKVDDAEPLRKAALACIDTIMDTCPQRLDIGSFLPYLSKGLADSKPDVQTLCHQILTKICEYAPGAVLGQLDSLMEPLDKTVNKQMKDTQVGTEVERANDLIRSGLRCIVAISKIEDVDGCRSFANVMEKIQRKDKLVQMLAVIAQDS